MSPMARYRAAKRWMIGFLLCYPVAAEIGRKANRAEVIPVARWDMFRKVRPRCRWFEIEVIEADGRRTWMSATDRWRDVRTNDYQHFQARQDLADWWVDHDEAWWADHAGDASASGAAAEKRRRLERRCFGDHEDVRYRVSRIDVDSRRRFIDQRDRDLRHSDPGPHVVADVAVAAIGSSEPRRRRVATQAAPAAEPNEGGFIR